MAFVGLHEGVSSASSTLPAAGAVALAVGRDRPRRRRGRRRESQAPASSARATGVAPWQAPLAQSVAVQARVAGLAEALPRAALRGQEDAARRAGDAAGAGRRRGALRAEHVGRIAGAREPGGAVGCCPSTSRRRRGSRRRWRPAGRCTRWRTGCASPPAPPCRVPPLCRTKVMPWYAAGAEISVCTFCHCVDPSWPLNSKRAVAVEVDAEASSARRGRCRPTLVKRMHVALDSVRRLRNLRPRVQELDAEVVRVPRGRLRDVPRVEVPGAERVPAPVAERRVRSDVAFAVVRRASTRRGRTRRTTSKG